MKRAQSTRPRLGRKKTRKKQNQARKFLLVEQSHVCGFGLEPKLLLDRFVIIK